MDTNDLLRAAASGSWNRDHLLVALRLAHASKSMDAVVAVLDRSLSEHDDAVAAAVKELLLTDIGMSAALYSDKAHSVLVNMSSSDSLVRAFELAAQAASRGTDLRTLVSALATATDAGMSPVDAVTPLLLRMCRWVNPRTGNLRDVLRFCVNRKTDISDLIDPAMRPGLMLPRSQDREISNELVGLIAACAGGWWIGHRHTLTDADDALAQILMVQLSPLRTSLLREWKMRHPAALLSSDLAPIWHRVTLSALDELSDSRTHWPTVAELLASDADLTVGEVLAASLTAST